MDKEDLELITRLEREEIQDIVKEELERERDKLVKARTLTEQEEAQVSRFCNFRIGSENFLKGITEIKAFVLLLSAFVTLILLLTAGLGWYISKQEDNYYDNFYKAKYEKDLAEYKTQLNGVASWAMTNIGMEARAMDMTGILQDLIHCKLKGFARKGGKCSAEKRGASFLIP